MKEDRTESILSYEFLDSPRNGTVDLVKKFFCHLKEAKNKLEALKLARDEIRKDGLRHPFHWAPFILVGEVK